MTLTETPVMPFDTVYADTIGPFSKSIDGNEYAITLIHTYIIGRYNPSTRIIDLVSHTPYVVCVTFLHKWRDRTTDSYFEKLFMAI